MITENLKGEKLEGLKCELYKYNRYVKKFDELTLELPTNLSKAFITYPAIFSSS